MNLSPAEVATFGDRGFLVKPGVFSADDMRPICGAIARRIDEAARELHAAGQLKELFAAEPFETRLARIMAAEPEAGKSIYTTMLGKGGGGYHGPEMFAMLTHPGLMGCIESLVGPEIVGASVYRIRAKLPDFAHGEVPWHQDSGYLLTHCDRHLIVTCWIPLVDATLANGCLYVLPDAHRNGVFRHYTGGHGGFLEIPAETLPPGAIPVEMKAGGVLFMTNLTPHASFKNSTDMIRWSIDLRYQSADAPNNVGEAPESYTPERDPVTMACYPPEADFVIRSPSHPEREVRTAAQFEALRESYEKALPYFPGRGWSPLAARGELKIAD